MKHHTKECISLKEMKTALKDGKKLEILSLGKYWSEIGSYVYAKFEDEKYLDKCYKDWNYRIKEM